MRFWEKKPCLSSEWQHLCGCESSQFLPKELLTAHRSCGSGRVCGAKRLLFSIYVLSMSALFPSISIDNWLNQDSAMEGWWFSHHGLLKHLEVDEFSPAWVRFAAQPVLCPRALLAPSVFSDSLKSTPWVLKWVFRFLGMDMRFSLSTAGTSSQCAQGAQVPRAALVSWGFITYSFPKFDLFFFPPNNTISSQNRLSI